ncbi:Stp1/IreP family PP2C-type Ser/Thr phosphatase [Curtanaerobium respiraculi]|uniref:Stp1/IreP family PP2C-type Ser/Thr phosphatase n=1 Tax=Curtanaerobium respiraculi TaxID=2949669 RepID=UPI0024B34D50|nr:Stp1/IreP family PP2C-type Ser/Thr phosphatase [Curtanaerobium respiraculi]
MAGRPSAQTGRRRSPVRFGSRTDIGCVRDHNEDSLVVAPPLYAVADGMGGHAAGEVASEIAVRTLAALAPATADTKALGDAVVRANYDVINAAQEEGRGGMGTTMTAAVLEGERLALAQVGDSRAYLLHQGAMQQITRDHSLMADMIEAGELTHEEARVHPQRSVITRALGSDPDMQPDLYEINVSAGDRLLLCSDGLTTMLEDDRIESILNRTRDPQRAASILVNEAIAAGGLDNVTVVVADVEGNTEERVKKERRHGRAWAAIIALALVAVVFGIIGGVYNYTQGMAYLKAENGYVAVYRGVDSRVFGKELSKLDHITTVRVDDLQPGVANRLKQGVIMCDSMEQADGLISDYQTQIAEEAASASSAAASSSSSSASTGARSNSSSSALPGGAR